MGRRARRRVQPAAIQPRALLTGTSTTDGDKQTTSRVSLPENDAADHASGKTHELTRPNEPND
jgi:hypothetical protein